MNLCSTGKSLYIDWIPHIFQYSRKVFQSGAGGGGGPKPKTIVVDQVSFDKESRIVYLLPKSKGHLY